MHTINFTPSGYQETYYQPSTFNFSTTSKGVIPCQQSSAGESISTLFSPVQATFPPLHHPPSTPTNKVSATYAHMMTVEQTAGWILTLGSYKGWKEAGEYAERFRKNNISGWMLMHLNHEMLRFELGVSNSAHRLEVLTTIQQLFPSSTQPILTASQCQSVDETDTESELLWKTVPPSPLLLGKSCGTAIPKVHQMLQTPKAHEYEPCMLQYLVPDTDDSVRMDMSSVQNSCSAKSDSGLSTSCGSDFSLEISDSFLQKLPNSRTRRSFFVQAKPPLEDTAPSDTFPPKLAEAVAPRRRTYADLLKQPPRVKVSNAFSSTSSEVSSITPVKSKEPSVTKLLLTLPPQQAVRVETIRGHFLKFNFVVKVEPLKPRSCVLVFQSTTEAKSALTRRHQIGYNLEPYQDAKPRKLQRPTPKRPLEYRVLSQLTIRSGKSLHGDILGKLYKNNIVTVNKIKGRRARVIKKRANSDPLTVGWVSSHTEQGIPLLKQMSG